MLKVMAAYCAKTYPPLMQLLLRNPKYSVAVLAN